MSDCKITIPPNASQIHSQNPLIAEYQNWLPEREVKKILKLRKELGWYQGKTADRIKRSSEFDPAIRIADNYKVEPGDQTWLATMADKVSAFLHVPVSHIEPTLLVRYQTGGHFIEHSDWWDEINSHGVKTHRQATFMVYLNSDFEGGQTHFRYAGITIEPEPGKALLFTYGADYKTKHHPNSYHSGLPVTSGTKYILIFFIRDNEFTDELREKVKY